MLAGVFFLADTFILLCGFGPEEGLSFLSMTFVSVEDK